MMDFVINSDELAAICGLPHIQQLAYLRGIRPYMDVKTNITGLKRRISYQSIAEQLYVEPHQGIKEESFSRAQMRRAVSALARTGVIEIQSEDKHLILKCLLASSSYSAQNKVVTNPSQKPDTGKTDTNLINTGLSEHEANKADIAAPLKAVTPLYKDNNYYIFLLPQFEKFWSLYPEKNSKVAALETFKQLKPDSNLCNTILRALELQITHREQLKAQGCWVPSWKNPANWLAKRCWEDEIVTDMPKEKEHAKNAKRTGTKTHTARDMFCPPCDIEREYRESNVVEFKNYVQG